MGGLLCSLPTPSLERLQKACFTTVKVHIHFACGDTYQKVTRFFITFGQAISRITNGTHHRVVKIVTNRKVVKASQKAQIATHQNLFVKTAFGYSLVSFSCIENNLSQT